TLVRSFPNVRFGSYADTCSALALCALPPIATAKADSRKRSCLLHPRKQTCAVQEGMFALGQKRISLWQQLVRETLHAAGHRCLDTGEIIPGQAWLGCDHLGPNNEERRDHDEDNGQLLAHCSLFPL